MIEQLLNQLGFKAKEIKVYLAVLDQGKTTPAKVANLTGINRTTVYSLSKDLVEKGVILEDIGSKQSYLVALPPEGLRALVQHEERILKDKKVLIDQAVVELQNFTKNTKYSIPRITFIYKEDIEDFLYKQVGVWNESILKADGVWWGFQDPSFVKKYQKWIDWYWKESAPTNLQLKLLSSNDPSEKQMSARGYDRRFIKFMERGLDITATTWVNGDYIIMIATHQQPHYLVQIHDATLAHNMREMFKNIWENQKDES